MVACAGTLSPTDGTMLETEACSLDVASEWEQSMVRKASGNILGKDTRGGSKESQKSRSDNESSV